MQHVVTEGNEQKGNYIHVQSTVLELGQVYCVMVSFDAADLI